MDAEEPFCKACGIHFGSIATLRKHEATIHRQTTDKSATTTTSAPTEPTRSKRPRPDQVDGEASSENVELAPLLGVLTDEQKDALILRAVQADPAFYDRILEQASAPLTEETADARLGSLDGEGVGAAIRWFMTIGVPPNALTLLVAASERCLSALEALADDKDPAPPAAPAVDDEDAAEDVADTSSSREELISAVEALPAAGSIGALWTELLAKSAIVTLVRGFAPEQAESVQLTLEGLQAAAATVRPSAPGVLIGPHGETAETLAEALRKLQAAFEGSSVDARGGGKARRK